MSDPTYEAVEDLLLDEKGDSPSIERNTEDIGEQEKLNPDDVLNRVKTKGIRRLNKNAVLASLVIGGVTIMGVVSFLPDIKKKKVVENSVYADSKPDVKKLVGSPKVTELPSGVVLTGGGSTTTKGEVTYGVKSPYAKAKQETIERVERAPERYTPRTEPVIEQAPTKSAIKVFFNTAGTEPLAQQSLARNASYSGTGLEGLDIGTYDLNYKAGESVPYVQAQYVPATTTPTQGQEYSDANLQDQKNRFYGQQRDANGAVSGNYLPVGRVITQGTIITGVLITAINTDLPGPVKAYVTENVYDTLLGQNVLIPQGSMLLAEYNSAITWGQRRVQVAWTRIIRPDGYSINLAGDPGVDRTGASGYNARVDEHPLSYLKGIGAIIAFTMLNGQIQASVGSVNPGLSDILNATNETINDIGSDYVGRVMDIQPTLRVKSGTKIQIFVNNDIIF